jgi:hypothetical protein
MTLAIVFSPMTCSPCGVAGEASPALLLPPTFNRSFAGYLRRRFS